MKITATNIAKPTTIAWNGKIETTGIYKTPTKEPIFLGKELVKGDEVSDKKNHAGEFKACYLFSEDHYAYWQNLYPDLTWNWGMFGENLTVSGLDETKIKIGDIYKLGSALVQITQPREPCYKLGLKFANQHIIKQFIEHGKPGTYVRVLEEGFVKTGDVLTLVNPAKDSLTTAQFYELLFTKDKNQDHIKQILNNDALPLRKRERLKTYLK
ncbi:MOSC domain-containing protein [Flavobacteriaceae bacterium XHP0103]|uniref:MOSC domain-containing protein n=1 Tax=Marixanthotalea marina TaxID=2844359 RepID=UPI00298A03BA|nr:MOSC domain-containing protein [Marixanthotalea marina]MBU3823029.1 MOSC domain-containing protein [Marixanthotalea marina]